MPEIACIPAKAWHSRTDNQVVLMSVILRFFPVPLSTRQQISASLADCNRNKSRMSASSEEDLIMTL